MKTKWGNAKINNRGYYVITSGKEGNNMKFLHRLIWEDFWKTEVPKGYVIHHRNFNKLDNCILNLQLMPHSEHNKLHVCGENNPNYGKTGENNPNYGRHHSEETKRKISEALKGENHYMFGKHRSNETKQKISKSLNNSGYFRVSKKKDKNYKQGFVFVYRYTSEGKRKYISSIDIKVLEKKVKAKSLKWEKYEED